VKKLVMNGVTPPTAMTPKRTALAGKEWMISKKESVKK